MSTPVAQPSPAELQPGLSEGARLLNTFVDPAKTFTDIRRKASWFVPWLLIAIFSYALIGAAAQKIGFEQIAQNQMRMNPKQAERMDSASPEQRAQAQKFGVTITKFISYAAPFLFLVIAVIIAAVLMATMNFGLGAEIAFGQAMAVVIYAHLPGIIKSIVAVISIYAGASPESFIFQNPVASNLGALVDPAAHPALFALGASIDLFTIWTLILMGVGFSCISKVKRGAALGVVFGWWAVITLISVGFAAAFA
jgi:hypothetical protein